MKRFLLILLILLMLTGCAVDEPVQPTTLPAQPTEPAGLYIANGATEQQTGGAIRAYMPEGNNYIGLVLMGEKPVLISDLSALTMLEGEKGVVKASLKAGESISVDNITFHVTDNGLSYYRASEREVVLLNDQLRQIAKGELPAEVETFPVVSVEKQEAYYCKGKEIRALNLQTGISRIVKTQVCQSVELIGGYFDAELLGLRVTDDQEKVSTIYISSESGQTVAENLELMDLRTWENVYMTLQKDGIVRQQLFGSRDGTPQNLDTAEVVQPLFKMDGAISYVQEDNYLTLNYYDLTTGKQSASIRLLGLSEPIAIAGEGQYVWFLSSENGRQMLYRWDVTQSPSGNETDYVFPLYTKENQDTAGLEACRDRAAKLQETYGVNILIGEAALEMSGGYELEEEYQVHAINTVMDELEKTFQLFPDNFLSKSLKSGQVCVAIVRSISGDKSMAHFYNAGNAYILLAVDGNLRQNFIHGFGYVMDSKVLGNSRDFDTWIKLNPKGFDYDYNYYEYTQKDDSDYLSGDTRAFVDAWSMTYPHEDRCRIFVAAMTPDNGEVFESETMQKKLKRVCEGIREAWDLEKSQERFLWEQYLK